MHGGPRNVRACGGRRHNVLLQFTEQEIAPPPPPKTKTSSILKCSIKIIISHWPTGHDKIILKYSKCFISGLLGCKKKKKYVNWEKLIFLLGEIHNYVCLLFIFNYVPQLIVTRQDLACAHWRVPADEYVHIF